MGVITHGMCNTKPYNSWRAMKERCYNKHNNQYHNYGNRGITVCDKWLKFAGFWEDMESSYKDGLSIDRINSNGNYCSGNCRWATDKEQANNSSRCHYITYKGETKTMTQWSEHLNINYNVLRGRLYAGWSIERAFFEKSIKNEVCWRGEIKTLKEWAKETGISYHALYSRICKLHWSIHRAMTTPYPIIY